MNKNFLLFLDYDIIFVGCLQGAYELPVVYPEELSWREQDPMSGQGQLSLEPPSQPEKKNIYLQIAQKYKKEKKYIIWQSTVFVNSDIYL